MGAIRSGILLVLSLAVASTAAAQVRTDLAGQMVDSATGAPLGGVTVSLRSVAGALVATATSGDSGRFRLVRLPSGVYDLQVRRVGYRPYRLASLRLPHPASLYVRLVAVGIPLDPVVVSASRTAQTRLNAPASVTVVNREAIVAAPALTPIGHVAEATGMDVARKGVLQMTYAVRGDVSVNSGALLTLTDYRYAEMPSLAINMPYLIPTTDDDIERIELERGPGTALYGPNSARGVLLILTRSPLTSPGASLSITGGTRSLFRASGRYAVRLGDRLGIKLSGQYIRANDWSYVDPYEDSVRTDSIAHGGNPATLLIGKRNNHLERGAAELRADWRVTERTTAIFTAGISDAFTILDQTILGAAQGRDWLYGFLQARVRHERLFVNLVYNQSGAGQSYFLRTGKPLVDRSRVLAGEIQDGLQLGGTDVVYGADARWTDPRTGGTIDGRNEQHDQVTELGAYVSTTTPLGPHVDLVGALRGDHNSGLSDFVLSPRLAVVLKPNRTSALRVTYNRAYTSPEPNDLYLDILDRTIGSGVPLLTYNVYARGIPPAGYTFLRSCGGLCMIQAPYAGGTGGYVPADATRTWPVLVKLAQGYGVDLSGVPAPAGPQFTRLVAIDPASQDTVTVAPSYVRDVPPARRTILNSMEVGYKGLLGPRVYLDVDGYVNHLDGVTGPYTDITPLVFYDGPALQAYLAKYLPASVAAQVAQAADTVPVGTVAPVGESSNSILVVERQGGGYTLWGADLTLHVDVGGGFNVGGSYSWVSSDSVPNVRDVGGVVLNVPRNKAYLSVGYRNDQVGVTAQVKGRALESFPVSSGLYMGRVAGYVVFDATAGIRAPFEPNARVQLTAYNVFDNRHQEFVGAPVIGRLLLTELHYSF